MQILKQVIALREYLDTEKANGSLIGFTPTMGALHQGHMSLVQRMTEECECGVASIFVNPKQFNDATDLEKYPRTIKADTAKLIEAECDVLFLPEVEEVYPADAEPFQFDLGGLDSVMEGEFRPGHFGGVVEVMYRLLNIVQPDKLYMGQKDFQQTAVIRRLIDTYDMPVDLIVCPTLREPDGLAMSSRNVRIDPELRDTAAILYETLLDAREAIKTNSPEVISSNAMDALDTPGVRPEYFDIVDGYTLGKVSDPAKHDFIVVCVAAWVGDVRLIDNLILKQ